MRRSSLTLGLICALFLSASLTAQSTFSHPGKITARAGIGVVPTYVGSHAEANVPPVSIQLGYQLSKKFSLSAFAGYSSITSSPRVFSDGLVTYIENKSMMAGLRTEFKHELSERLDIFGGSLLGFNYAQVEEFNSATNQSFSRSADAPTPYDPNPAKGQFLYSAFVGADYFLTKNIGVYGEIGYGISLASIGLTFNL